MIKLIAIDLDGTLLNNEKQITPRTKLALQRAKEKGVKVVLCTGRPLLGMVHYLDELGLRDEGDFGITYNGGLVQKTNNGEILAQKKLTKQHIEELYQLSQALELPMNFIDLKQVYALPHPENRASLYGTVMKALPMVSVVMEEVPADIAVNKAVFCFDQVILDEAITRIPASLTEKYTIMKSRPFLLELLPQGVDKGQGIASLCQLLNIDASEVMT